VLTHCDYWSGNVVWRDGVLAGIVDWSGAARGPRGFDVGWCRLDLYLLFDERVADVFLAAYEDATGHLLADMGLWDGWASRAHMTPSKPGRRTTGPWAGRTSTRTSFGGVIPNGQAVSRSRWATPSC